MFRAGGWGGLMLIIVAGCSPPALVQKDADPMAIARGEAAARRLGCAICHDIPGIGWPKGRVGPALHDFGDRMLVAGQVPNRPVELAAFIRNPASMAPGSAMPAMPMTDGDARDMAAWLQSLRDE